MGLSMESHINIIWDVFKRRETEAFYLFYAEENQAMGVKVSENEQAFEGSIDTDTIALLTDLKGKDVLAVHNHPFGKPHPSNPDFFQKDYIESVLRLMGIRLVDFAIVSPYGYTSFADSDLMEIIPSNSHYTSHPTQPVIPVKCPKLLFAQDVQTHSQELVHLLSSYNEILINNQEQYASIQFPGEFLLEKRRDFESKNIFLYRKQNDEVDIIRLQDIDRTLSPFEIYVLDGNELVPWKKNGFL